MKGGIVSMTYSEFIKSIKKSRPLNEWFKYSENHHIIPRCCGGSDDKDNLIYLTYKEHFIAHKLLAEENPSNNNLIYAYWMMCNFNNCCTPDDYQEARLHHSRIMSEKFTTDNPIKYCLTEEYRRKMSEATSGEKNGFYGRKHTEETRNKMSEIKKVSYLGEGNPFYGRKHTEESRLKMSLAQSKPRGPRNKKISYNLVCKSCGNHFKGTSPSQKFCINCKN